MGSQVYTSRDAVAAGLQRLHADGVPLNPGTLKRRRETATLYSAALRLFGDYAAALAAAGFNSADIYTKRRPNTLDPGGIVAELMRRFEAGDTLQPKALFRADVSLYQAALKAYGSYEGALAAAGLAGFVKPYRRKPVKRAAWETGQRIRRCREAQGWTQAQAAKRCGVSESAWANWECGIRAPAPESLLKAATALGVQPSALAGDTATGAQIWEHMQVVFRQLAPAQQRRVLDYAAGLLADPTD